MKEIQRRELLNNSFFFFFFFFFLFIYLIYDIIKTSTTIGYGSESQGTTKVHGTPLKPEEIVRIKEKFGLDPTKTFNIPNDVINLFKHLK